MIKNADIRKILEKFPGQNVNPKQIGLCRVPGRVNLIGEHTDYNGFSVLPITLNKEVHAIFTPRNDNQIYLVNEDSRFPSMCISNAPFIPPSPIGSWDNYIKAAIIALNQKYKIKHYPGFNLYISSNLPIATGLSSSSALVVTASLVYLKILGKELDKDITRSELAELMAEAEHFVGTRGGGMDQTVILNGAKGHACKIDFFPIRTHLIPLFENYTFVVCDSTIRAQKTGECLSRYNIGPRLCRLSCALIEHYMQKELGNTFHIERLSDLWTGNLCLSSKEIHELTEHVIQKDHLSIKEIAYLLELSPKEVRERWLPDVEEPPAGFPLKARIRHVISEHSRVEKCQDALLANDAYTFGVLMNESHYSCANDYQISISELDTLTHIARRAGAIGSRLTGAGFGGCTVNLVPNEKVEQFMEYVEQQYYKQYLGLSSAQGMFIAETSPSASYLTEL
ncbi:MAG: galactokinase [Candidatus Hydrogenedens sp.]|nr:galactokinase [Candidatus Hydrogenedens sp.]